MRVRTPLSLARAICALAALSALAVALGCVEPKDPGERVYRRRCAACHGRDGRGDTRFARNRPFADLTDGRWKQGGDAASVRRSIAEGVPRSPMEGFRGKLSDAEMDAVTGHVLGLASAHLK